MVDDWTYSRPGWLLVKAALSKHLKGSIWNVFGPGSYGTGGTGNTRTPQSHQPINTMNCGCAVR